MKNEKLKSTTVRFTDSDLDLIKRLQEKLGLGMIHVIRFSINAWPKARIYRHHPPPLRSIRAGPKSLIERFTRDFCRYEKTFALRNCMVVEGLKRLTRATSFAVFARGGKRHEWISMVRPERFELPTFWFVAVAARRTNNLDGVLTSCDELRQMPCLARLSSDAATLRHTR